MVQAQGELFNVHNHSNQSFLVTIQHSKLSQIQRKVTEAALMIWFFPYQVQNSKALLYEYNIKQQI